MIGPYVQILNYAIQSNINGNFSLIGDLIGKINSIMIVLQQLVS